MNTDQPSNFEQCVRLLLQDHPEHIPGVVRDPDPAKGKTGLCLDKPTALAFMERSLKKGLTRDRNKLAASIAKLRAEIERQKRP
jgi:hypothetical protein